MYGLIRRYLPTVPPPVALGLSALWYGLLIAMLAVGVFEPQAEFQYLAM
jgi:hypothetical protein